MDHLPSKDRKCHHTGFTQSCRSLVADGACDKWSNLQGRHPQTGEPMNKWGCDESFTHLLLLEVAKAAHEGAKATLDFRNAALDPEVRARQVAEIQTERKAIGAQ